MARYRVAWRTVVGALTGIGVVAASQSLPLGSLVSIGVCAAVLGCLLSGEVYSHTVDRERGVPPPAFIGKSAALAAVGTVAVSGLLAVLGAVVLLGVGLLAACSPVVVRRLSSHLPQPPPTVTQPPPTVTQLTRPDPPTSTPSLAGWHSLSDTELCWRWRTSFTALQRAVSPTARLGVLETRSALLDELARRDPVGFARWLDGGARAASDPTRYFTGTPSGPRLPQQQRRDSER